ncbi:unnamed protein product [Debaryomyces tyrocola]|nr:unnamed protein product [Debaryomyces tyrocola]
MTSIKKATYLKKDSQICHEKIIFFPDVLLPWRPTILAYASLSISSSIGFPIDAIKTRMQSRYDFKGYHDCIKRTYISEGVRGFYRGITIPLISNSISRSLTILLFIKIKPIFYYSVPCLKKDKTVVHEAQISFLSGATSAGIISIFTCPFDSLKIHSQILLLVQKDSLKDLTSSQIHYSREHFSIINTLRKAVKYKGLRSVYSGFKYHLSRDTLSGGIYYSSYEVTKFLLSSLPETSLQTSIFVAGGIAGVLGGLIAFPLDTAKSLAQKNVISDIIRIENGLDPLPFKANNIKILHGAVYKGIMATAFRAFIVNLMFFTIFEFSMARLH